MSTPPKVAVMLPVYNGEQTIARAVTSLFAQTHENWHCIVVDDGSTDATRDYLARLNKDCRFRIITFPANRGRPFARQAALEAARGEFLAFLDADDFYHPRKLATQVSVLLQYPDVALVSCGMGSLGADCKLKRIRAAGDGLPVVYTTNHRLRAARAASMLRLRIAQEFHYNMKLRYAQDTDFFERYCAGREYLMQPETHYYYGEFESVSRTKIIKTYYFEFLQNASARHRTISNRVRSAVSCVAKAAATVISLPFVSTEALLLRRGRTPTIFEQSHYNEALEALAKFLPASPA